MTRKAFILIAAIAAVAAAVWGFLEWRSRAREARLEAAFASAKPGELVWRVKAGWQNASGPVVCEGAVVCYGDTLWNNEMRAFAPHTGTRLWERATDSSRAYWMPEVGLLMYIEQRWRPVDAMRGCAGQVWPTPAETYSLIRADRRTICVCSQTGLVALQLDDKSRPSDVEKWRVTWPAGEECYGRVLLDGRRIIIAGGNLLRAVDSADGTLLWRQPAQDISDIQCSAGLVCASLGYGDSTVLETRDSATGRLLWSRRHPNTFVLSGERLFAGDDEGVHCLDARAVSEKWVTSTGGRPYGGGEHDGTLYFTRGAQLCALDAETGKPRWTLTLPAPCYERPAFSSNAMYLTDEDAHLLCVKTGEGR